MNKWFKPRPELPEKVSSWSTGRHPTVLYVVQEYLEPLIKSGHLAMGGGSEPLKARERRRVCAALIQSCSDEIKESKHKQLLPRTGPIAMTQ